MGKRKGKRRNAPWDTYYAADEEEEEAPDLQLEDDDEEAEAQLEDDGDDWQLALSPQKSPLSSARNESPRKSPSRPIDLPLLSPSSCDSADKAGLIVNLTRAFDVAGKSQIELENKIFDLLGQAKSMFNITQLAEFAMTNFVKYFILEEVDAHQWAISLLLPAKGRTDYDRFEDSWKAFLKRHR